MQRSPDSMGTEGAPLPKEGNKAQEDQRARLDALAHSLAKTRQEAVNGRMQCGIESIWKEDEEHYEGLDEKNKGSIHQKGVNIPWQLTPQSTQVDSTIFVNITRPYVDAAAAKVGDILIPTDDRPWSIKETPLPELIEKAKGGLPDEVIQGMADNQVPEQVAVKVAQTEKAHAEQLLTEAREKAERAQKRIEDWHVEGQWHAEMRKVIDDAARIGTGILKGPIPVQKRQQMFADGELVIKVEKKPVSKRVLAENCFPDPACGSRPSSGRYHWERDFLTEKQLADLAEDDSYLADQIEKCLEEGPQKRTETRSTPDGRTLNDAELFEIWYFYGFLTREDMEAAGCSCEGQKFVMIPALITMVNDRVIKAAINPLDTGEFPYDYFQWQPRSNSPWGYGVARQIREPQRIVTAGVRTMLTNAGRAAGPIVVLANNVQPADNRPDITPWKVYYVSQSDTSNDVNKVVSVVEIPALTNELMQIIQFGLKIAEDVTGLPLLLQGQSGSAPETLGGQQLVDRNAAGVLRRIARNIDDSITEPHIRRYYTYLLLYGPEDIEKGEFVIDARGSTALVEREIYKQETSQLLQAALNPAFGLDPKKTMKENLRANNRRPEDFQYTEQELRQQAEQAAQQKPDPRVETAKINAQSKQQLVQLENQFESGENQKDRQLQYQLALMDYANRNNLSLAQAKTELAKVTMTLTTQKQLAREGRVHEVAKAAAEPPGRAPKGQAFQK